MAGTGVRSAHHSATAIKIQRQSAEGVKRHAARRVRRLTNQPCEVRTPAGYLAGADRLFPAHARVCYTAGP